MLQVLVQGRWMSGVLLQEGKERFENFGVGLKLNTGEENCDAFGERMGWRSSCQQGMDRYQRLVKMTVWLARWKEAGKGSFLATKSWN